jgi:hypothetical protein
MALVLRSKNQIVFRSDVFPESISLSEDQKQALSESRSFVKVRFASEQVLPDKRHLTFLLHAVDAMVELGSSNLVYDLTAERIWDRENLRAVLLRDPTGTDPDFHLNIRWTRPPSGGIATCLGFKKIGLDDLKTTTQADDERVLVLNVMESACSKIWIRGSADEPVDVEEFGDLFRVEPESNRSSTRKVKIVRIQAI